MGVEVGYNGDTLWHTYTLGFIRYESKQKRFPLYKGGA